MTDSDVTYVDNTILTTVAVCDTKTVIRHVLGYASRDERAPLESGRSAHEAMAYYFRSAGDVDGALAVFTDQYYDWSMTNVPPDDRLSFDNAYRCLAAWFDQHPFASLPFTVVPEWVEIGFSFPLTDDGTIVFVGRIDAIVRDIETQHLRILDNKFTYRVDSAFARNFRMDTQFSGYIWAGQMQLAEPIDGGFVNGIEMSKLPSSDLMCKKHAVKFAECSFLHATSKIILVSRTPEQIRIWRANAIRLAKKFRDIKRMYSSPETLPAVSMQGQFIYKACPTCDAYEFCASGKPVQMLDSLFVHSPWTPWIQSDGSDALSDAPAAEALPE